MELVFGYDEIKHVLKLTYHPGQFMTGAGLISELFDSQLFISSYLVLSKKFVWVRQFDRQVFFYP